MRLLAWPGWLLAWPVAALAREVAGLANEVAGLARVVASMAYEFTGLVCWVIACQIRPRNDCLLFMLLKVYCLFFSL